MLIYWDIGKVATIFPDVSASPIHWGNIACASLLLPPPPRLVREGVPLEALPDSNLFV